MSDELELKKLNIRSSNDKPLKIKAEEIPNLVPEKILAEWIEEDNPYFKIQAIKFPIKANGYNYTKSFFESFIKKMKTAPIPGSRDGHDYSFGGRAASDLLLIGGKIETNEKNPEKGTVYLKNYIPPVGASGENDIFIKELKSNMIDFSLVSYTKDERIENKDGSVSWNVIESLFGERNDAVPREMGAMEQKLNSVNNSAKDGENNKREKTMPKAEVLNDLKTLQANLQITLPEVAKAMGLESLLITDEQKASIQKLNSAQKLIGEGVDIVEFINESISFKKQNAKVNRENILTKEFGLKEYPDTKKENKARTYAEEISEGKELTDELIAKIKENSIYVSLASERADLNSDENDLTGEHESKKSNVSQFDETKVEV